MTLRANVEQRRNYVANPAPASTVGYTANYGTGGAGALSYVGSGGPTGGGFVRATWMTASTAVGTGQLRVDGRASQPLPIPVVPGQVLSMAAQVRCSIAQRLALVVTWFDAAGAGLSGLGVAGPAVIIAADTWTRLTAESVTVPAGAEFCVVGPQASTGTGAVVWPVGATLDQALTLLEASTAAGDYFDGATAGVGSSTVFGSVVHLWTGTANASASIEAVVSYGVVPTVEPSTGSDDPPRVRLDVTDTGTPSLTSVTVARLDPDGVLRPVRTEDGNPLTLSTSGSDRVGLLYDYEMPYGAPVTYSTVESPGAVSASVTVAEARVWLVHPGVPALSMPIEARAGSLMEESWDVQQGIFWPMGREYPVVQTDGVRKAAASSVTVAIESLQELWNLKALLADAGVLLLNVPADLNLGIDACYIAVGAVRNRRLTDIGSDPYRSVELPFQVVDRPSGGSQAQRTYADVLAGNASYADVMSGYPSYLALLAGP